MTDNPRVYGTRPDPAQARADHENGQAIAARQSSAGQMAGTPDFDRGARVARQYAVSPNGGGEAHPRAALSSDFAKGLAIGRRIASGAVAVAVAATPSVLTPAGAILEPVPTGVAVAPPKAEHQSTRAVPPPTAETPLNAAQVQIEARRISEAFHRGFL
ncbi:hypothetical protein [Lichenifustis flavocetrariae]|uniref:Uncharacterized protein n=1 Tax=Lichenifustis flavocetrariae TaxID=2949735 RepID=A0AA41Z2P5_9HYPH|nr:hypothetical protein [Lichenifustis flavocetrariae]MCW6513109.1 hypothetical protein [Lichenifustis flavocetrariae]